MPIMQISAPQGPENIIPIIYIYVMVRCTCRVPGGSHHGMTVGTCSEKGWSRCGCPHRDRVSAMATYV
jgi:hypothetical protein